MKRVFDIPIFLIILVAQYIIINPATVAAADWSSWKNFYAVCWVDAAQKTAGLAGGEGFQEILAITYAKSNPNVAYLVVDVAGVYKSTDAGTT